VQLRQVLEFSCNFSFSTLIAAIKVGRLHFDLCMYVGPFDYSARSVSNLDFKIRCALSGPKYRQVGIQKVQKRFTDKRRSVPPTD